MHFFCLSSSCCGSFRKVSTKLLFVFWAGIKIPFRTEASNNQYFIEFVWLKCRIIIYERYFFFSQHFFFFLLFQNFYLFFISFLYLQKFISAKIQSSLVINKIIDRNKGDLNEKEQETIIYLVHFSRKFSTEQTNFKANKKYWRHFYCLFAIKSVAFVNILIKFSVLLTKYR